jgi:hypothetical protein
MYSNGPDKLPPRFGDWLVMENRATDIQLRFCGYGHAFIFIFQKNREPN